MFNDICIYIHITRIYHYKSQVDSAPNLFRKKRHINIDC